MSLNSSEVISLREVCGSTPAEGAQPAEGTLPRKATKPLAPQALKAKRSKSTFLDKAHLIGLQEVLQVFDLVGELAATVRIANHDTLMREVLQLYTRMDI